MGKKILLTGFDPFGGELTNPSWEAVRSLEGQKIAGYDLVTRQLPTVFGRSLEMLKQLVFALKPEAVICVGQAGGRPDITVERVAINVDDARIKDNEGQQPVSQPIVADGPVAYWSTLPIKEIVAAIKEQGIPSSVSNSTGTFVCNHVFYGLRHYLEEYNPNVLGGFIHIPYLPEQGIVQVGKPTMARELVIKALEIAVEVTAKVTAKQSVNK